MSKEFIGDACAYIPAADRSSKTQYPRIGVAFCDTEDGRISIKLDTLPLPGANWSGWINIFPRDKSEPPKRNPGVGPGQDAEPF